MTGVISDDALKSQQSRIMNAMRATTQPDNTATNPTDLLQALTAQASGQGNYFDMMRQFGNQQKQTNVNAETGIYSQMKDQVARGNQDASAIDQAITGVAGDDPKAYAAIVNDLHSDPEPVTAANAKTKVMKYAAERGINPLGQQQDQAKLFLIRAQAAKEQADANQANMFNPVGQPKMGDLAAGNPSIQPGSAQQPNNPQSIISQPADGQPRSSGTNQAFLAALPASIGTQVKALAEGRMQFPSGYALKSPYWQQMMQAVSQYDPNFDTINYNARAQTRKDFTSGKSAQNITSINTAIGHLGSLSDAFTGLKNSDYPMYNSVANAVARQAGNTNVQTALKDVNTKALAVSGELAKVFRSTGMSQKEIEDWKEQISPSNTPAENKKVIDSAIELMNSRLDAIGQQYNQGMGATADPMQLLSPKAQITYKKLTGNASQNITASPQTSGLPSKLPEATPGVVDYREYFK